jgi:plasmid stabilization system protein ParE
MIYTFIISPKAVKQRDKIIMWYEERSSQATDNFIKELDETFHKICLSPFNYRSVHRRFKILKMKTYPYYIIFSVEKKSGLVIIAKLYHTARNPENKYRGLGSE